MSKRRKNSAPNLPQATLDRARRQAGLDPEAVNEEEVASVSSESKETSTPKSTSAVRRKKLNPAQLERSRKRGELDHDMIQELLHNPTKIVSEEELAKEYNHVLVDLRNMGILAVVLMVVLVGLAQFI